VLSARRGATTAALLALLLPACSDGTDPERVPPVPAFVFVSDAEDGTPSLYRWRDGTVTRLTSSGAADVEPHSAAGKLVFTTLRHGDPELYVADLDGGMQRRLTTNAAIDAEPALHPAGQLVLFVSNRSGTPRIWLTDADGAEATPLPTGSASFVPEHAPAWSPSGDRIAFTSSRTGTSQVYVVVPGTGGNAVQLTSESGGAFDPAWLPGGATILYVAAAGTPRLRSVDVATRAAHDVAADARGLGEPSCGAAVCLATAGPYGDAGDVLAVLPNRPSSVPRQVVTRAGDDRQPAVLVP